MASDLKAQICEAKEKALKEALMKEGAGAKRYEIGIDFTRDEIRFLKTVYFPYLLEKGYSVRSSSDSTDCSCDGLCEHAKLGWYVVYLQ
jgi:hypothetical protein